MRLDWAIPCMGVRVTNGVIDRLDNANWDILTVRTLPAPIEFIALLRVVGHPEDFTEEADRNAEAYLTGPGMEPLVAIQFELSEGDLGPDHQEGWEFNGLLPVVVQFTAGREGPYMLDFYLNGRYQRSIPFRVLLGQPIAPA